MAGILGFLACLLVGQLAVAADLIDVDVNCWNQVGDSDGSQLCQFLVITGKVEGQPGRLMPELSAPDAGGPKTFNQADLACVALGYRYALRFEMQRPAKPVLQIYLNQDGESGGAEFSEEPFLQHLNCGA